MSEWTPRPGELVSQRYRLEAIIGEGGAGVVWRAQHTQLDSPVALKLLAVDDASMRQRFVHEARAAAALRSPHVVQILDAGEHEGVPFLAMELLEGETLGDRLGRGPLAPDEAWSVMRQLGEAVSLAHEHGIVHRDLKPANVFLVDEATVKVLDFGVAKMNPKLMAVPLETKTGDRLGTPYYMSPEQLRSSKLVDHRADLWSLAVLAYHCLVGSKPFDGTKFGDLVIAVCVTEPPVPSAHAAVPSGFDAWFARAVARDLDARFSTCRELTDALGEALS